MSAGASLVFNVPVFFCLLREVLAITFVFDVAGFYVEVMLNILDQDFFHTFDNIADRLVMLLLKQSKDNAG